MRKRSFEGLGVVFVVWAVVNTLVSARRYGIDQGMYFWFCNVALLATGAALIRRNRSLLVAFLGVASFTQLFWILDNIGRMFFGRNLFGLVEFLYHPGLPLDEFVLSHYHYLIIPTTCLALCFFERRPNEWKRTLGWIVFFNALIFGISYFVFPARQNVNCIHSPCFDTQTDWEGWKYSVGFFLIILSGNVAVSFIADKLFARIKLNEVAEKRLVAAYATVLLGAVFLTGWDVRYKKQIPSFRCENAAESESAKITCGYTLEDSSDRMLFVYTVENKTALPSDCETRVVSDGAEMMLHSDIFIEGKKSREMAMIVPYPKVEQIIRIMGTCSALKTDRDTAGQPRSAQPAQSGKNTPK